MSDGKKIDFGDYPSSRKAARQSQKRTIVNKARLSRIRTLVKKVFSTTNKDEAAKSFVVAQKAVMKGVTKEILKHNTASRIVSRLSNKVKSLT